MDERALTALPKIRLPGVELPISQLIMGCDNKITWEEGAPVWDHWLQLGGTGFDTAYVYGAGQCEKALGDWISRRGVEKDIVVTVKGANNPDCNPEAIGRQLSISLERLQLSSAPVYIMHRDNPDVPIGEFVDVLNGLRAKGLIGVFGGSNWSVARFQAARDYAAAKGLQPLSILNNNLSLAVMEREVWPGCVMAHDDVTMGFLRNTATAHFSWSSQARGYFLPAELRDRLPEDTRPETCLRVPQMWSGGDGQRRLLKHVA
jgi:aryl-alcohol dehydrogenase-like predicted oxidoreductase